MGEESNDGTIPGPKRALELIVAFYITQEEGLPAIIQGLGQTVVVIDVRGPSGSPMQKYALKVTFPIKQSIEQPVGLVGFGSDHQCHFVLPASDASKVHCKVWAQLNSGPDVWIIEDSSTHGTRVLDEENLHSGMIKILHSRCQASKGLQSITIGSCTFCFRAPVSVTEVRQREDWFRLNKPIPVTKSMLLRQLDGRGHDWIRMNRVGKGGFGDVYRYMEKTTALFIAIKHEQTKTKEDKARVMKEIDFMKTLRHPFLIDILFNESDNKPLPMILTAMPLCLGHLRYILPLPTMSVTERIMFQMAEGLRFMHSNLILHRDLKPENVLVVSLENIKIADYGWATSLKDTDSLYDVCGTLSYCAPEAFKPNEIHTPAIDVYSLGAIFYSMLDLDKVDRGWVTRDFRGRKETFNTTFENASRNPPRLFGGLVQSMLAPNPIGRCSLDECIEIVTARKYGWTKRSSLMPVAITTQSGTPRAANVTRLQQTPFGQARATANMLKPTHLAQVKRPENRQSPQQAPVKHDRKHQQDAMLQKEPQAPLPQAVAVRAPKPRKSALVQGVNFQDGPPSYEEATGKNPFAKLADSREITKKRRQSKLTPLQNVGGQIVGQNKQPIPQQSQKSNKKHVSFSGVSPVNPINSAVRPHVGATHSRRSASHSTSTTRTRGQHPGNSRHVLRHPREHAQAMDIRRVGTGRIRKTTVTRIKAGAVDMAKGLCQFGWGLGQATCNVGVLTAVLTAEGIMGLYDMTRRNDPAPNDGLVLNDYEQQLVASMRAHSVSREAERQRGPDFYRDEGVEHVRSMALRGGTRFAEDQ